VIRRNETKKKWACYFPATSKRGKCSREGERRKKWGKYYLSFVLRVGIDDFDKCGDLFVNQLVHLWIVYDRLMWKHVSKRKMLSDGLCLGGMIILSLAFTQAKEERGS